MENKLEQLLNSLIEKGWKPRGLLNEVEYIKAFKDVQQGWRVDISYEDHGYYKSIREILSKESGLWQFVCENGLVEVDNHILTLWEKKYKASGVESVYKNDIHFEKEFEYRLIESSLKDESELEDFLLQNIKVGNED